MKITALHVRCVDVPMSPHRTSSGGVYSSSPLVLLRLDTDEGVSGHSITFTYAAASLKPAAELMRNLAPLAIGKPLAPAALSDDLHAQFRTPGTQGLMGMVLAGIDVALWDAFARAAGLPLCRLLGADARPVLAYGAIGYEGVEGSARTAEAWARQGLRGVKAKLGYPSVEEDLAVVRALRKAVGPDVSIMVDYNQRLTPDEAGRRLRALDGEGLHWIEEPVASHDFAALARLARSTTTPLQAGENWWGPLDFRHALEAGFEDNAMPDVMKCGGVTGWMRVAAQAQARGTPLSNHLSPEISAQLLAASPTARWLGYTDWWNPILREPLALRDGYALPSEAAGSGVEFDEKAVARYIV